MSSAWPRTSSTRENTATKHGGGPLNDIYKILDGINLSLTRPDRIPNITTPHKFAHRCLSIGDSLDNSHRTWLGMTGLNLTADQFLDVPVITRTQGSEKRDTAVLEKQSQVLEAKDLSILLNNILDNTANLSHMAGFDANGKLIKVALDRVQIALMNAANIFTAAQTIQVNTAIPFTIYRPSNVASASNAINFDMQNNNATPERITYAQQNVVLTDPTDNSEDAEYRLSVMVNGILSQVLSIIGNQVSLGPSGTRITHNMSDLTATRELRYTDAHGRVQLNEYMNRYGVYRPSQDTMGKGDGLLEGLVCLGVKGTSTANTGGKYDVWSTRPIPNDAAGIVKLDSFTCRRITNPMLRFAFLYEGSTVNRRVFFGVGSKRLINLDSDVAPLNVNEPGFFLGYSHGSGDTTWQIFHNDNSGACVKESTGLAIPGIATNYIVEIQLIDSPAGFKWTFWSVSSIGRKNAVLATNTVTTDIPSQGSSLFLQDLVVTIDGSVQNKNIHYDEVNP